MLNNIGLPGIFLILLVIVLPIFLLMRSGKKKRDNQTRIADALEELAKAKKDEHDTR